MKTKLNNYLVKIATDKCKRELAYLLIDATISALDKLKLKLKGIEKEKPQQRLSKVLNNANANSYK